MLVLKNDDKPQKQFMYFHLAAMKREYVSVLCGNENNEYTHRSRAFRKKDDLIFSATLIYTIQIAHTEMALFNV